MSIKKVQMKDDREGAYFRQQEEEMIKKLREKATEESGRQYCEEHKGHCFRCGTKSLVEVEKGKVKIDICVNKGCGAVHLDPGELDAIVEDKKAIRSVRSAVMGIFK